MKKVNRTLGILAAVAAFAAPLNGLAQQTHPVACAARSKLIELLSQRFKETQQAIGLVEGGAAIEILVSQSGTWTVLISKPNGQSCIAGAGTNWTPIEMAKPTAGTAS